MKTTLKIIGYNKGTKQYDVIATNTAAPAKLFYNGGGAFHETFCATKNAEKLLKGVNLNKYANMIMIINGVKVACKNNANSLRWIFAKAGGLF